MAERSAVLASPSAPTAPDRASAIHHAARLLLPSLQRGQALDAAILRAAMEAAFGASDTGGAWVWKDAYEACEAAQVLFLRRHGPAMRARAGGPAGMLGMLARLAALAPTHTRRSEESVALQQFSTPIALGFAASLAAAITSGDLVLEPSAGTGLLAVFAALAGGSLALNEFAETRAELLGHLFPGAPVSRHDAAQIHDYLKPAIAPSVVLMNPPFSVAAHVEGRMADAAFRHVGSALAQLVPGGRLVAITGISLAPDNPSWREDFVRLQARGRVVFSAGIDRRVYARHGTAVETRLTVIDRVPAEDPTVFPPCPGIAPDAATLLEWVTRRVQPRPALTALPVAVPAARPKPSRVIIPRPHPIPNRHPDPAIDPGTPLAYEVREEPPPEHGRISDALYESYSVQTIVIPDAQPHPTKLVQSAAMASVAPPRPRYRPHLPSEIVSGGLLSNAQIESVIYAGEAHAGHLAGSCLVDATYDQVSAAPDDAAGAVCFRRGWFLGDGTGAGKGRQVAGVILDNWLRGRRSALWVSKSDKLIEDAQRDWSALGQERLLITPLARFRQGTPIRLDHGILFTTYATLRSAEREGKASRLDQIIDWLGRDFDGVIVFDEAHAMANAAGDTSERGERGPSQQGRAGLRLQHALPDARVLYVSATGATSVQNLAYAQRLGLWGGADFPFATRQEFVSAMEAGGIAAMEVLARDLKALGLYAARSLSYEGIEVEIVEHALSPEQVRIYDAYAEAFQVIHANLAEALEAANVTGPSGTLNRQAKAAARSAFESNKQRFFNHLITAMKVPTLIGAIERNLAEGAACIVQLVSTGEALLDRRLAEIPAGEWADVQVDITPREYVLDYLAHGFPTQLFEVFTDTEGNLLSRPVFRDGQPVQSREVVERRDRTIEHLAALPAVQGALDQVVQRFGTDQVAEVTGRSRRVVRKVAADGTERLAVETRPGSANLAETQAFMDDEKRILVFSDAGGTGRSYHADLAVRNQRRRVHYLLEPGWKADTAIQGLGRSNRTNQRQPPLFRPVATDVRGEKRFLSTIARRLDSLGAITRGQRQTGGQGLFRADDNLESQYARAALRQFYGLIFAGKVECCSLQRFEEATGLDLSDRDGSLREDLPPITTFLNRLLALPIALQNGLFAVFEELLASRIESAIAAGSYDVGVETLTADSLRVTERRTIHTHAASGAETRLFKVMRQDRNRPLPAGNALALARDKRARLLVNAQSGRAAVQMPAPSLTLDDGEVQRWVRLVRPMTRETLALDALDRTHWTEADAERFAATWTAEVAQVPEFTESAFHIVTGLLLPIWNRLPDESLRVYRLQTDDGERVISRPISPAAMGDVCRALGLDDAPALAPDEAWSAVLADGAVLHLAGELIVRRAMVMGAARVELTGFTDGAVDQLKALGLTSEIIAWRLRLFIPVTERGPAILAALFERSPLIRVVDRVAA
ncbi:strawberry notch family protein [Acidiphilium multivorum]|nr:strawberry notch family protein [Acidiphilium multivorum]